MKSRWREGGRLGQRVRPRHDGDVAPGVTRNARGASGRTWSRGRGGGGAKGTFPRSLWKPAQDLEVFGELPALQSGRTRSQSWGLTMSASYADALLAYAKRTVEEEAAEIERAHNSLPEERLEKEGKWPEDLERRGVLLGQREEEQDSDCPPPQWRSNNNPR